MKSKTVFFCTECGNETPKWSGQCTSCGSWNSIVEQPAYSKPKQAGGTATASGISKGYARDRKPVGLDELEASGEMRFGTGLRELDRVLGGGAVVGVRAAHQDGEGTARNRTRNGCPARGGAV